MEITEISSEEYAARYGQLTHLFNSVAFTKLNRHKADAVRYLMLHDRRARGAIVIGEREATLTSPFSAPFGWFTLNRRPGAAVLHDMHLALADYASGRGMPLRLVLPPMWHDPSLLSAAVQSLQRIDGGNLLFELNYHLPLSREMDPLANCSVSGRCVMRRALESDVDFDHLPLTEENIIRCYDIVARNHAERGYPMRMSRDDMVATATAVGADLFVISNSAGDIASAIIYEVSPGIAQVIHWGDLNEHRRLHPMNRIAYELTRHYSSQGFRALDLGPATENGKPNGGLALFKESIGSQTSLKAIFTKS